MSDETTLRTASNEISWDDADLDEALARTKAIHRGLVERRRRVLTAASGFALVVVVAVAALVLTGGDDAGSRSTVEFADEGTEAEVDEPAATPTTAAAPVVPQVGDAMTVRRVIEIESFVADGAAGVVHVAIACETAGDRIQEPGVTWQGNVLLLDAVVESDRPGTQCAGEPLSVDVALPAGVDPALVEVRSAR